MSLQPQPIPAIPEETAHVAHTILPQGNVYMQMRVWDPSVSDVGDKFSDASDIMYPHFGTLFLKFVSSLPDKLFQREQESRS